jgi:hypothetical protein
MTTGEFEGPQATNPSTRARVIITLSRFGDPPCLPQVRNLFCNPVRTAGRRGVRKHLDDGRLFQSASKSLNSPGSLVASYVHQVQIVYAATHKIKAARIRQDRKKYQGGDVNSTSFVLGLIEYSKFLDLFKTRPRLRWFSPSLPHTTHIQVRIQVPRQRLTPVGKKN